MLSFVTKQSLQLHPSNSFPCFSTICNRHCYSISSVQLANKSSIRSMTLSAWSFTQGIYIYLTQDFGPCEAWVVFSLFHLNKSASILSFLKRADNICNSSIFSDKFLSNCQHAPFLLNVNQIWKWYQSCKFSGLCTESDLSISYLRL